MRRGLLIIGLVLTGCDRLFNLEPVDPVAPDDAGVPCVVSNVTTGREYTCAIVESGDVWCWGENNEGQVQPGGAARVLEPVKVALPGRAVQVSGGRRFSCAVLETGAVWCWGDNDKRELGAPVSTRGPIEVPGIPAMQSVGIGGYAACAHARSGEIWCWGNNEWFQAGPTTGEMCAGDPCASPQMLPGSEGAKQLALGHQHGCFIGPDDQMRCWGANWHRQLADTAGDRGTPTIVPIGTVTAIAASGRTSCAISTSGATQCWGFNFGGQLGTGDFASSTSPRANLIPNARAISIGSWGGCASTTTGTLQCWGETPAGDGVKALSLVPRLSTLAEVDAFEARYFHVCAIRDGSLSCWGNNRNGQLGRGFRSVTLAPTPTTLSAPPTSVGLGTSHGCALVGSTVQCWGSNQLAAAGDASLIDAPQPTAVATTLPVVTSIVMGYDRSCALGGGLAECWGSASTKSLGTGVDERHTAPPRRVLGTDLIGIALGKNHLCTLPQSALAITCYGRNDRGQLGDGSTTDRPDGATLTLSTAATKIVAGEAHTCLLATNGEVRCWGNNNDGQLGDASTTQRTTPTLVNVGELVLDLVVGAHYTCALGASGSVYCWGDNSHGQLGRGDFNDAQSPTEVTLPAMAVKLWAGESTTCARLANDDVYCWGRSDVGQTGTALDADQAVPARVDIFRGATAIAPSADGVCAIVGTSLLCAGLTRILGNGDVSALEPGVPVLSCEPSP